MPDARKVLLNHSHWGGDLFKYTGENFEAWKLTYLGFLLSLLTLGIYIPWYKVKFSKFQNENTFFYQTSFSYQASGSDLF